MIQSVCSELNKTNFFEIFIINMNEENYFVIFPLRPDQFNDRITNLLNIKSEIINIDKVAVQVNHKKLQLSVHFKFSN